jgi:serralysin
MAYITETTDAADNTSTTYTMNVGDFFTGSASSTTLAYNDDWIRITLAANTTYTASMNSLGLYNAGLNDAYLQGYDSAGNLLLADDDGGPSNYAQLTFTTDAAGVYYIAAGAASLNNDSGGYMVTITLGDKASFDHNMGAAALYESETSWSPNLAATPVNVTYAIRNTGPAFDANGDPTPFQQLTASQVAAAQQGTLMYSEISGITFTQVNPGGTSQNATVLFGAYTSTADGAGAYAYFPGNAAAASVDGDVWLNNDSVDGSNLRFGTYSFFAMIHELGHAVGLSHPGDYNAAPGVSITYAANAQFIEDSQQYTIMSYFAETDSGADFGGTYADTLMLYDIFALHKLYGADLTTRSGATIYGFNSNAGDVYNFAINTDPALCIWDGAGADTIDLSGWGMTQTLNLNEGTFSNVGGLTKNLSIAFGAVIENAIGGSGSDTITGNAASNTIYGRGGTDTLSGGAGADTIYGGTGVSDATDLTDTINGDAGNDILHGNGGDDTIYGGADSDTVYGGGGSDTIYGGTSISDAANEIDELRGQSGDDTIYGNGGDDQIYGGFGFDNIFGGAGNDTIFGGNLLADSTDSADTIDGGAGNDIISGNGGIDIIYGGADSDTIRGGADNDVIYGGSSATDAADIADELRGESGNDTIYGAGGGDTIIGGIGTDILYGGIGNDILTGGVDGDQFVFNTALNATNNADTITDFLINVDDIVLSQAIFAGISATLDATEFQIGAADSTLDRIIYNQATGQLFYDSNGNGAGGSTLFATVTAGTALTINDFVMVA